VSAEVEAIGFTPDELEEAAKYGSLGPEYFAGRKVAEAFMAKFHEDHFKSMVDEFADQFRDKLWSDIADFLLADTESNIHSGIVRMVEGTIRALLTGEEWAMQRYPFCDYRDGEKIRKAIAEHSGDAIAQARNADLEKQITSLRSDLERARR
jgi:hypothetical protein